MFVNKQVLLFLHKILPLNLCIFHKNVLFYQKRACFTGFHMKFPVHKLFFSI